jgi:hypothetical protein
MSDPEFAAVMAYLEAACGVQLPENSLDVYYDLLGDLDVRVLQCAAKRVALEHPWHTFPSAAEIRQAASETLRGQLNELSPAEAWQEAWSAVSVIDLDIPGSLQRVCERVPPLVVQAMKAFGIPALVCGKEPVAVVRAQFLKIYEQLAARDRRVALLPASVRQMVEAIGKEKAIGFKLKLIGGMPDEDKDETPRKTGT